MELYERIENTRFLGREFLVWIWWKSELLEGEMVVGDFGPCEVWIDDALTLEARGEAVEQTKLKGGSPSATPEAKEALRQGKVPTKARLAIKHDERDFSLLLDGESFSLSGAKTPALLQDEQEERFYERMYLVEELEEMLQALFREFLLVRLSPYWESKVAPAIRAWIREEPELGAGEHKEIIQRVMAEAQKRSA
jgi:hypothetical protein